MRLVHTAPDGRKSDVLVGFLFSKDGQDLRVTWCPEPHKASSQGKVSACLASDIEGYNSCEYFASVYNMKWIEREDQGWLHPEMEMRTVFEAYADIFGVDLSGLNLADAIAFIRSTTIASFPDNRLEDMMVIKKWLDKQ